MAFLSQGLFGKLSLLWGGLFFLSAAMQWNDPDPLAWAVLYAAAGGTSLLAAAAAGPGRSHPARALAALVGVWALAWAASLAATALPHLTVTHLFQSMKAATPAIEESRELLGLLLVACWMGVVFFRLRAPSGTSSKPNATR